MKPQKPERDWTKTPVTYVLVHGVRVGLRVDESGRLGSRVTGYWGEGDAERAAKSTMRYVWERFQRAADQKQHRLFELRAALCRILERKAKAEAAKVRTARSTKTKRERAAAFWGNEYLAIALEKHPTYGESPLALAARDELVQKAQRAPAFAQHEHYLTRGRITDSRARAFKLSLKR